MGTVATGVLGAVFGAAQTGDGLGGHNPSGQEFFGGANGVPPVPPNEPVGDPEDDPADEPVQVTGGYLTNNREAGLDLMTAIVNTVTAGLQNAAAGAVTDSSFSENPEPMDSAAVGLQALRSGIVGDNPTIAVEQTEASVPSSSTPPTDYVFLIQNLTGQPLTYSIRGQTTQWAMHQLPIGKHHTFNVNYAEMDLKYVVNDEERQITIPGDHVYAFADVDGVLQFCVADPDSASE